MLAGRTSDGLGAAKPGRLAMDGLPAWEGERERERGRESRWVWAAVPASRLFSRAAAHRQVVLVATLLRRRPSSISLLFSPPSHPPISTTSAKSIRFIVATSITTYLTEPTVTFT